MTIAQNAFKTTILKIEAEYHVLVDPKIYPASNQQGAKWNYEDKGQR